MSTFYGWPEDWHCLIILAGVDSYMYKKYLYHAFKEQMK